jgi:hypothetical protein
MFLVLEAKPGRDFRGIHRRVRMGMMMALFCRLFDGYGKVEVKHSSFSEKNVSLPSVTVHWGLVHFSARNHVLREKSWPKTWTCPPFAAIMRFGDAIYPLRRENRDSLL